MQVKFIYFPVVFIPLLNGFLVNCNRLLAQADSKGTEVFMIYKCFQHRPGSFREILNDTGKRVLLGVEN